MVGHNYTVRCVQMIQEKQIVVSGSYDETLKIWLVLGHHHVPSFEYFYC